MVLIVSAETAADVQGAVAALRQLADALEKDPKLTASVDIEAERVGYMIKTSVVLWSVAPDAVEQTPSVQWCDRLVAAPGRPDRLCRVLLNIDGTCPGEASHRRAARW